MRWSFQKHHMAPWSSTAVLRAGTLRGESCSDGQEAGSRAAPSFLSSHQDLQTGFNACLLVPALWDGGIKCEAKPCPVDIRFAAQSIV